jgi:hypothetical protein
MAFVSVCIKKVQIGFPNSVFVEIIENYIILRSSLRLLSGFLNGNLARKIVANHILNNQGVLLEFLMLEYKWLGRCC